MAVLLVLLVFWLAARRPGVGWARSWCRRVLAAVRKFSEVPALLEKLAHHMDRSACASEACAIRLEAVQRGVQEVRCMVSMKCEELISRVDGSARESGLRAAELVREVRELQEACVRELIRVQECTIRESGRLSEQLVDAIGDNVDEVLMLVQEIKDGVVEIEDGVRYTDRLRERSRAARAATAAGSSGV